MNCIDYDVSRKRSIMTVRIHHAINSTLGFTIIRKPIWIPVELIGITNWISSNDQ